MPLVDTCHVTCLSYSPLLGGFSIVLSDGRAACLVSTSLKFDPNGVQGVWAAGVEDVTTTAINHKYRLMAFGRDNSHGVVFCIDESTGGLELSHRLALPTRDYPGCPGPVTALRWTPDSTCLAMVWAAGGFSIWSTFGTMIFCNLGWDHGPRISDAVRKSPYNIQDLDWSAEGYQLWCVNGEQRQFTGKKDPDFCPFPDMSEEGPSTPPDYSSHLGDSILVVPFVKSPISVNPAMAGHASSCQLYLQGEDRLYLNLGEDTGAASLSSLQSSTSKQWTVVTIPHTYISSSWPIRYTASDAPGSWVAVAGRTGLAHYNVTSNKWTLFGNQTQEKDFIVTGGMLWWRHFLVIGCFNISANRDEVRLYARDTRLENTNSVVEEVEGQVLLLNRLGDRLVGYTANSHISIYQLHQDPAQHTQLTKVQDVDAGALSVHPACVVSIMLTHLRTETGRQRSGDTSSGASCQPRWP